MAVAIAPNPVKTRTTWKIDPAHTSVEFSAKHLMITTVRGSISDVEGTIRFDDIVEDESVSEEFDELTGLRQRVIIEDREKKLHPHIELIKDKGEKQRRALTFRGFGIFTMGKKRLVGS